MLFKIIMAPVEVLFHKQRCEPARLYLSLPLKDVKEPEVELEEKTSCFDTGLLFCVPWFFVG